MDPRTCLRTSLQSSLCKRAIIPATLSPLPVFSIHVAQDRLYTPNKQTTITIHQRRRVHTRRHVSSTAVGLTTGDSSPAATETMPHTAAMSCLPLSNLLRSYIITSISSIPILLRPSLATMSYLANSKSRILNPDKNPVLKMLMKKTFYVQFCAGENSIEVQQTIDGLKSMGYKGVILGHAREVVMSKAEEEGLNTTMDCSEQEACNAREIAQWKQSTLDTIELTQKDDFVALKFTGAGRQALQHLKETIPCAPNFEAALHEICQLAEKRGVNLLFDAEQASLQNGIDNWTLYFMKAYNKGEKPLVYGTYQAYAKRTPALLAQHLAEGQKHNFAVGVKLVRGAYLGSDPRELFWENIEGTHICYDTLAQCVIQRQYSGLLQAVEGTSGFPRVGLVLASHNAASVANARQLRDEQARQGVQRVPLAYGQLMGMADNVSCELVQEATERSSKSSAATEVPQAYKYLVWGTLGECMKYLLRRAQENKDAVSRTIEARQALGKELARRMGISR